MTNWSIGKKLMSLCAGLLSLTLAVGAVGWFGSKRILSTKDDLTDLWFPAIKAATITDGRHDEILGDVYHALYLGAHQGSEEERKDVAEDIEEDVKAFHENINKLDKLKVGDQTHALIEKINEPAKLYSKTAEEIAALALSGQVAKAQEKVPQLQTVFKQLEESIAKLDEDAEQGAQAADDHGDAVAKEAQWMSALMILLGLLFGIGASMWLVRGLVSTLGNTIEVLNRTSDQVSKASTSSSASATQLSEASTQQAASLQETMASVEEISAMVNQNAESAGKVQGAVDLNQVSADEGTKSVSDMLVAIEDIKGTNDKILSQMEESNREFGEIVKIISEIGEKTKVINDIVFQTKLLSFNASVEAARAGEHGKGFAVVAEEVGNLAQMSGNAAKQITDMLTDSIKKVNDIVDQTTRRVDQLVEVGKDKISMGQSTAQRCREALTKINNNARTIASMVAEISNASKEQAQGVQEINKAMGQLDQVTQQNAAVAQQSSQQAELLNGQAHDLANSVAALVSIVNGAAAGGTPVTQQTVAKDAKPSNVIPISKAAANKRVTHAHAHSKKAAPMKKAAGESVPAGNDPGFEEF